LISLFNIFDLFSWSYKLIVNTKDHLSYIKYRIRSLKPFYEKQGFIKRTSSETLTDRRLLKYFVNNYLKEDGVLALRLLSRNSHDMIVSDVINSLFDRFKEPYQAEMDQRRMEMEEKRNKRTNDNLEHVNERQSTSGVGNNYEDNRRQRSNIQSQMPSALEYTEQTIGNKLDNDKKNRNPNV
jgi:outer membrane receptor for Fe3+-dicitrate